MKLSKKQRNVIYKKALKSFLLPKSDKYVCCHLQEAINGTLGFVTMDEAVDSLPEFAKYKNKTCKDWPLWWPNNDIKSRVKALENCIKLTK